MFIGCRSMEPDQSDMSAWRSRREEPGRQAMEAQDRGKGTLPCLLAWLSSGIALLASVLFMAYGLWPRREAGSAVIPAGESYRRVFHVFQSGRVSWSWRIENPDRSVGLSPSDKLEFHAAFIPEKMVDLEPDILAKMVRSGALRPDRSLAVDANIMTGDAGRLLAPGEGIIGLGWINRNFADPIGIAWNLTARPGLPGRYGDWGILEYFYGSVILFFVFLLSLGLWRRRRRRQGSAGDKKVAASRGGMRFFYRVTGVTILATVVSTATLVWLEVLPNTYGPFHYVIGVLAAANFLLFLPYLASKSEKRETLKGLR